QITQAQSTLSMYESQLNEIIVMRDNAQAKYDSMIPQYNESIQLAKEHIADLEEDLQKVETEAEKQVIQVQIDSWKNSLANAETAKQALEATLSSMNDKINAYEQLITNAKQEIATQKAALSQAKVEADAKFAQAETELTNGQKQYSEGVVALEKQKTITEEELAIAKEKLDAAKVQLDNIDPPSWYVLDRHSHYSYRDYESVADRMDGIAKVFPVFFLIVAALVCLTTMTRMVDEQRNIIGTYKALGYSKIAIAFKYLSYALIAGIIGSIVGCLIGMHLFPSVIFNAWNLMYNLPTLVFTPQLPLALISSVCVVGVTLMAAGFACYKELVEVPASLMRPKAPKQGKKILLEKIPILWSRFSFTMKVTARNIFRYKKRFFMTVIGISGCTALLLAGFGIKDSIAQIVDIQYGEIIQYDALIKLDNQDALINRRKAIEKLNDYSLTKDSLALTTLNASVDIDNATQSISLLIPDDSEKLKDYINLRTRNKKEQIELSSDGAVVSEKLAKNLKASVGDMISITFDDGIKHDIKISSICENYVGHNIYITPSYYKTLTSQRVSENTVLLKMKKANEQNERKLGNYFVKEESVSSISFNSGVADTFADTISSISFVTYVLIAAAGLLAFVVLYNLTNVNISERLREIATIKVLGFYDLEVASYVYRENIFLTLIGSLAGLGLGVILHRLIMNLAEMPEIMFGRNINLLSYCLAVMITALFAMIVNLVMYNKLKKIPMVESLKSVE
ncbi:MAG: ABC transporter permease, partial [Erysipelotrichia bacterium]|nr:ABC transporter permease [Erysipelotrichia bacterium]